MEEYIKRLRLCGYNVIDATIVCVTIAREFGQDALIEFILDAEAQKARDGNVARI